MNTGASLANVQRCRGGLPGGQRVGEVAGEGVGVAETERVKLASMYAVWIEKRSNQAAGNGADWLGLRREAFGCLNMQGERESGCRG